MVDRKVACRVAHGMVRSIIYASAFAELSRRV